MVKCQKKGSFAGRTRKEGETFFSHLSGIGDPNDRASGPELKERVKDPEVLELDAEQRRDI
jgi:hypothetical protein